VSDADDGFLARWAKRKARVQGGLAEPAEAPPPAPAVARATPAPQTAPHAEAAQASSIAASPTAVAPGAPPAGPMAEPEPPPTMDDVARLGPSSDYSRFVGAGVDRDVSNAALKKLFKDPHFNVMDGLDTYIDDYGKPDPLPPGMLRKMAQSAMLGLFDEEVAPPKPAGATDDAVLPAAASPDGGVTAAVAQSTSAAPLPDPCSDPVPDDDPDLRLQQDDGAGRRGAAPEPGA
jgi:hypothetical protein